METEDGRGKDQLYETFRSQMPQLMALMRRAHTSAPPTPMSCGIRTRGTLFWKDSVSRFRHLHGNYFPHALFWPDNHKLSPGENEFFYNTEKGILHRNNNCENFPEKHSPAVQLTGC